jgi:hypothetical protein
MTTAEVWDWVRGTMEQLREELQNLENEQDVKDRERLNKGGLC